MEVEAEAAAEAAVAVAERVITGKVTARTENATVAVEVVVVVAVAVGVAGVQLEPGRNGEAEGGVVMEDVSGEAYRVPEAVVGRWCCDTETI